MNTYIQQLIIYIHSVHHHPPCTGAATAHVEMYVANLMSVMQYLDRRLGKVVRVPESCGDVESEIWAPLYHILPKPYVLRMCVWGGGAAM